MQTFHLKYFVRNKRNLNKNNCIRPHQLKEPSFIQIWNLFFLQECNTTEKENCSYTAESLFYPCSIIGHFQTLFQSPRELTTQEPQFIR